MGVDRDLIHLAPTFNLNLNSKSLKITSHVELVHRLHLKSLEFKNSQTHCILFKFVHKIYLKTLEEYRNSETDVFIHTKHNNFLFFFLFKFFANQRKKFSYIIFLIFFIAICKIFIFFNIALKSHWFPFSFFFLLNIEISNWKTTWIWIWNPRFYF